MLHSLFSFFRDYDAIEHSIARLYAVYLKEVDPLAFLMLRSLWLKFLFLDLYLQFYTRKVVILNSDKNDTPFNVQGTSFHMDWYLVISMRRHTYILMCTPNALRTNWGALGPVWFGANSIFITQHSNLITQFPYL